MRVVQIAKFVVSAPVSKSAGCCVVFAIAIALTVAFKLFTFTPQSGRDFFISSKPAVQMGDALTLAEEQVDAAESAGMRVKQPLQTEAAQTYDLFLLYKSKRSNLLSPTSIAAVQDLESIVARMREFQQFCLKNATSGNCFSLRSVVRTEPLPDLVDTAQFPQLDSNPQMISPLLKMYAAPNSPLAGLALLFFDAQFSASNLQSEYLRTHLQVGFPLNGFSNAKVDIEAQLSKLDNYILPLSDFVNTEFSSPEFEVVLFGNRIVQLAFNDVTADLMWLGGSIAFVLFYIGFHTRSIFLAWFGLIQILMSFPFAMVLYKLVYRIEFFQTLQTLALFILLGVGADDIFVFFDAWQQAPFDAASGLTPQDKDSVDRNILVKRFAYTFRRAAHATLVTTFTTVAAFLATAISELVPIATFGIFAATLIACNYVLCVTFFFAAMTAWWVYVRNLEEAMWRKFACSSNAKSPEESAIATSTSGSAIQLQESAATVSLQDMQHLCPDQDDIQSQQTQRTDRSTANQILSSGPQSGKIDFFFGNWWAPRIARYDKVLVLGMGVITAVAIWQATQLSPLSEQEQWFPDRHFIGKGTRWLTKFGTSDTDRTLENNIILGVSGIDQTGVDVFNPSDIGRLIWDEQFDLSQPEAQWSLYHLCTNISALPMFRKFSAGSRCWFQELKAWRESRGSSFPVTGSTQEWNLDSSRKQSFVNVLKEFAASFLVSRNVDLLNTAQIGIDSEGNLRMVKLIVDTSLKARQPYSVTKPEHDRWQAFLDARNADAPEAAGTANQVAFEWQWMETERSFVVNTFQGMGLSISIAALVLILSTRNVIVGLIATACIGGVVSVVIAVMVLSGWELGVTESIACVVVIGFSVDYVVHIANAYTESSQPSQQSRVAEALQQMGVSVVAGGVTTFGAGAFLFGGTFTFYTKFAILMISTVLSSLIWALIGFPAIVIAIAPKDTHTGSFTQLQSMCCRHAARSVKENQQQVDPEEATVVAT